MFIKFAVFLVGCALTFVIIMIIRERSKTILNQNNQGELSNEAKKYRKHFSELTIPELKQILVELKEHRNSISSGFVYMNSIQKNSTMARGSKINKKMEKVMQAIEEQKEWDSAEY